MNLFRPQGVVFLAVEQNSFGGLNDVRNYAAQFQWDFPIGWDNTGGNGDVFNLYETERHNYFVVGVDGTIAFRANSSAVYSGTSWSSYQPRIIEAIQAALAVPVRTATWSGVKALYR